MTMPTSSADRKARTAATFNQVAADYDNQESQRDGGAWLVDQAALPPGAHVLDVATGTGWAALAAAKMVGPEGSVIGVDLARDMLEQAQHKADRLGISNIQLREGDAERLDFADDSFDAVICASALFFMPDMLAAVREWRRVVKPGGQVAFTSYGTTRKQPLASLYYARLGRFGVAMQPSTGFVRLSDPNACRSLLREAGLAQVEVRSEQRGYYVQSPELYWQTEIWSSSSRSALMRMTPSQLEQFKAEHLAEVAALATPQGIWLDAPFNFAVGWKL